MSTTLMTEPAAGWYHDPADSGAWRWWDGSTWTDHIRAKDEQPISEPVAIIEPAIIEPVPTHAPNFEDFAPAATVVPEPVAVAPAATVVPEPVAPAPAPVAVAPEPVAAAPEPIAPAPQPQPEPAASAPAPVVGIPQPGQVVASPSAPAPLPMYASTPVTDQMYWHSSSAEIIEVPRLNQGTAAAIRAAQRGPVPRYVRDWNDLGSPNTAGIWLLAFSPFLGVGLYFAVASAMAMAGLPTVVPSIAGGVAALLLNWVFAALDTRALATRGYHAPRLAWMLLFPPLAYLIARGKSVRRESKAAWAPELVYILCNVTIVAAFFVFAAVLAAMYAPLLSAVQ